MSEQMIKLEWWDGERMKCRKFVSKNRAEAWAREQGIRQYNLYLCGKSLL